MSNAFVIYNILNYNKRVTIFLINSKVINMHLNTNVLRSIALFYKLEISIKIILKNSIYIKLFGIFLNTLIKEIV